MGFDSDDMRKRVCNYIHGDFDHFFMGCRHYWRRPRKVTSRQACNQSRPPQMVGQASNQAIAVDRVGTGTHRAGQILGKALQANCRRPNASRVTTKWSTNTNPASQPQVSHPKTYKRFTKLLAKVEVCQKRAISGGF